MKTLISHAYFETPVLEVWPENANAWIPVLLEKIASRQAASPGMARSNIGGWHSTEDLLQWGGPEARALAEAVLHACIDATIDTGKAGGQDRFAWHVQMWANVSPPGASNNYHAHPGAFWSAVFFLDDGGAKERGRLVLQDPRFPLLDMTYPDLRFKRADGTAQASLVKIAPEPGKLVCFPAWLIHGVEPHDGNRDRVSIAINLAAAPAPASLA